MTRPEDIPQDAPPSVGEDIRHSLFDIDPQKAAALWAVDGVVEEMDAIIARAILAATEAERERCAGIADQYVWDSNALDHAPPIGLACHHQSLEIAAAIRKATP